MSKYLFAGAAAFVLLSGPALAQDMTGTNSTSTVTTTSAPVAPVEDYSATKTQKTLDSSGVETDKSQSYSTGIDGTKASSTTETTAPDGSQITTSHDTQSSVPAGDTTTTHTSTTTTDAP